MAADPRITNAVASAACDAIVDAIDGGPAAGTIKIYSGTIPTDADTAIGAQVLRATLTFSDPAFGAAANGVATASAITGNLLHRDVHRPGLRWGVQQGRDAVRPGRRDGGGHRHRHPFPGRR